MLSGSVDTAGVESEWLEVIQDMKKRNEFPFSPFNLQFDPRQAQQRGENPTSSLDPIHLERNKSRDGNLQEIIKHAEDSSGGGQLSNAFHPATRPIERTRTSLRRNRRGKLVKGKRRQSS
ncbi:hypothetical protein BaRGS_00010505 [Batillaria attramentaria]|uniref:Uncharacterized protein n=1 Tax=Batillaria attramentaria TaxID=370345 RepID=A0ABD0LFN8_9CAEN